MSDLETQIDRFLEELGRNCSANTLRAYGSDLKGFPPFANCDPANISAQCVRDWMADLYNRGCSAGTIRRHVAALRAFFRFLKREGRIGINPAELVLIPKSPGRLPEVPTVAQIDALLAGVKDLAKIYPRSQIDRDTVILELLYGCGVRVSELTALNVDDIDLNEGWLLIRGKGKKRRQMPYGAKAQEALRAYLQRRQAAPGQNALFVEPHGVSRLSARSIRNIVKEYGRGVLGNGTLHPHSLRHAYAAHLVDNGIDLRSLQELLGHSSISSVNLYRHLAPRALIESYDEAHPKGKS